MKPIDLLRLVALLASSGCARQPDPPAFVAVADLRQLMASIVEPAAETYWDAVGTVEDSTGVTSMAPRSKEDWDEVRNAAYIVTESGNLMMMAPRAKDQKEWMTLSRVMIETGRRAIKAAEAHDTAEVFNAGAALYEACTSCHTRYAISQPRPPATK